MAQQPSLIHSDTDLSDHDFWQHFSDYLDSIIDGIDTEWASIRDTYDLPRVDTAGLTSQQLTDLKALLLKAHRTRTGTTDSPMSDTDWDDLKTLWALVEP